MMKRILLMALVALVAGARAMAQGTVLVLPADVWMNTNNYVKVVEADGMTYRIMDYSKALGFNRDMSIVLTTVQRQLQDHGFDVVSTAQMLDGLGEDSDINNLELTVRPDIVVYVDYSMTQKGPLKNVHLKMEAIDPYCRASVAMVQDDREGMLDPLTFAIRKMVAGCGEEFSQQLIDRLMDLRQNGREVRIAFRAKMNSNINFKQDKVGEGDTLLCDYLFEWMCKQAVNQAVKQGRQRDTLCEFRSVRIPLFDKDGNVNRPERHIETLTKAFAEDTGMKAETKEYIFADYDIYLDK